MNYCQLLKKRSNSIGWALLIYHLIFMFCAVAVAYFPLLIAEIEANANGEILSYLEKRRIKAVAAENAWGHILGVCVGGLLLLLWKGKSFTFGTIFHQGKAMTFGGFLCLIMLATSTQMLAGIISSMASSVLSQSASVQNFAVNSGKYAFSMFLYAGIAAPIFEEIFFRGAVMRHLQPYGKSIAIVGSAFVFGLFHGNIVQIPFAFAVGLVYGYTAVEHSIWWSMLLHMFNNLVLSQLPSLLLPVWGYTIIQNIMVVVVYGSVVLAAFILVLQKKKIAAYRAENPIQPGSLKAFFLSPGILVFTIYLTIYTIYALEISIRG